MDTAHESPKHALKQGTARRPLFGLTILLVEDSRYCSEAVRLLCLRSGARLRRADSKAAAFRHLATYRPSLVIVDIGLPDGSGLEIVEGLANLRPNAPVIFTTSGGDPDLCARDSARAGADGFLPKPLKSLSDFQKTVLGQFPDRQGLVGANVVPIMGEIKPDELAVQDDLRHARDLTRTALAKTDSATLRYCAQFLESIAESSFDGPLRKSARALRRAAENPLGNSAEVSAVIDDLAGRVAAASVV